jgi:hypothetical protein
VPDWVAEKFAEWIGAAEIAPWPRDEWLIGDAADPETLLCEIEWIDEVAPGEHSKWLEAAADAIETLADSYADD